MRFLLVHVLLVALPIAGIGFARFYEREMLRSLEDDMIHQGALVAELVASDSAESRLTGRETFLRRVAKQTRMRIRLLDAQGQLVADSHRHGAPEGAEVPLPRLMPASVMTREPRRNVEVPERVEDLSGRAEVQAALAGKYGSTTRLWKNGDRLFLFSALPIRDGLGVVYLTRSTNPVRAAMYRIRRNLVVISGAAFLTTLVVSLFLAWTISRPLARLTKTATAIAGGDRTRALELERHDEIGQLAQAFAAMTAHLDGKARETAELAANLSHEFKSPLTSLRGAAELLLDGAAEDPAARERFLNNMLADAQRLDRLVTRLLELSRVEADASPEEAVDLAALVREVCVQRPDAPIDVVVNGPPLKLKGRRALLSSALGNLVDNALQHALPQTRVRVTVASTARSVRVSVHNASTPISAANLARLWDRFFTTRAESGGSGLGLPIVASVARAHGGIVDVVSTAEAGTTFALTLPVV